jgi:hypothetical protein
MMAASKTRPSRTYGVDPQSARILCCASLNDMPVLADGDMERVLILVFHERFAPRLRPQVLRVVGCPGQLQRDQMVFLEVVALTALR